MRHLLYYSQMKTVDGKKNKKNNVFLRNFVNRSMIRSPFSFFCRFLLTRYAEALGQFGAASQSCNFSLRFFHSNQKDVSVSQSEYQSYSALSFLKNISAARSRPQSTSSRRTSMARLKKSQSSLPWGAGWTNHCTLPRSVLKGCCWTCSLRQICKLRPDMQSNNFIFYFFYWFLFDWEPSLFFSVLSLEESVKAMSLSSEEDDIPWDSLRDNRDLTVFTNWDPKERYRFFFSHRNKVSPANSNFHLFFFSTGS